MDPAADKYIELIPAFNFDDIHAKNMYNYKIRTPTP